MDICYLCKKTVCICKLVLRHSAVKLHFFVVLCIWFSYETYRTLENRVMYANYCFIALPKINTFASQITYTSMFNKALYGITGKKLYMAMNEHEQ